MAHGSQRGDTATVRAAETLRRIALDESLKHHVANDPVLAPVARRVAHRYIGGDTAEEALDRVLDINARGHAATVDYMGESCRDRDRAVTETGVFVALARRVAERGLNCSISLDLSHIGSVVDAELGYENAVRIAEVTAETSREMMISMEGSDRTDLILATHRRLCERFDHVGVTVQTRLHRTADDLPRLLELPGRIRLVKGSYHEPAERARPREDAALAETYLDFAQTVAAAGHPCSIATHDWEILNRLHDRLTADSGDVSHVEFETLLSLGPDRLAAMRDRGHRTREYVVFGVEWWLYVCNRLAEDPERLPQALVDAAFSEVPAVEP